MKGHIAPVQAAIVAKLTEKLPARPIWADVPEKTDYPYLVFAGAYGTREPNKQANLWNLSVDIAAEWRERGTSMESAGLLIDEAIAALTGQDQSNDQLAALEIEGFQIVGFQVTDIDAPERDTEVDRARIVARFRLHIQEI